MADYESFLAEAERAAKTEPHLLRLSRKVCHLPGIASIVVGRNDWGGLRRAFFIYRTPGHINPHSHRYGLILKGLCGNARNVTYDPDISRGLQVALGSPSNLSSDGTPIILKPDDVHTVLCSRGDAWTVDEIPAGRDSNLMISGARSQACAKTTYFENNEETLQFLRDFPSKTACIPEPEDWPCLGT